MVVISRAIFKGHTMRHLLCLLFSICSAPGQTAFPTRVDITSNSAQTVGGELRVNDSTNSAYVALTSTSMTFPNSTALAGNTSGLQVWNAGAKRAEVLPGGTLGSGRLHLGNTAGTYYTGFIADPAMATSAIYQLPGADGTAGDCLSTNGAAVLSWVSCSGGGSTPPFVDTTNIIKGSVDATKLLRFEVDGLTTATTRVWTAQDANITVAGIDYAQTWTATQTMRDVNPSVTDTYKLGDDSLTKRWYSIAANRIEGICPVGFVPGSCSSTNNYITTRKLDLYDSAGSVGGGFWNIQATAAGPVNSSMQFKDQAGNSMLALVRQAGAVTVNNANLDGNLLPVTTATYDLGTSLFKWNNAYVNNFIGSSYQITGAVTNRCLNTDGSGFITETAADCIPASRTISTTGPLTGGGDLSANRTIAITQATTSTNGYLSSTDWNTFNGKMTNPMTTTGDLITATLGGSPIRLGVGSAGQVLGVTLSTPGWQTITATGPISWSGYNVSCPTCVTSVTAAGPIASTGGTTPVISCSTCVTTSGGQTIANTTTFSTVSISTALAGTFNLSGNQTVTGNWYARSFSGSGVSCAGVGDGWLGWDTAGQYLIMCAGGARYRVNLAAY